MAYFQNVFNSEFVGVYVVSDRKYAKDYRVKGNQNTSALMCAWNDGPYNTTSNTKFALKCSIDAGLHWFTVSVTLTSGTARTADQVVDDLNTNSTFSQWFSAYVSNNRVFIRALVNNPSWVAYVPNIADSSTPSNTAESVLGFNLKAPVAELPSYFTRYAVGTADGKGSLILLSQPDENFVITNAGLSTTPKDDWQFLGGTSGLFTFRKQTVDSSSRITQIIEYPCGAAAGDLAKKIQYTYTAAKTSPDQITEIPYTLQSGDLITPP
jgi:hypothetical protein